MIPAFINCIISLLISALHLYWGLGGNRGIESAFPERMKKSTSKPGRIITLAVALVFGAMGLFYLHKTGQLPVAPNWIPGWLNRYGLWLLAGIFLVRAVGNFRQVGFFKQTRTGRFARLDTLFYSPLCLLLALNTFLVISYLSKS